MSLARQIAAARAPLFAFAAMGVLWGSYAALVPDIVALLRVSDAAFGSLLLATPIAAVLAMLVAPGVARALGPHVLPISTLALALSFSLPGWMSTPVAFAAAMVAVGAANGFLDVTMNARVSAIEVSRGLHLMNLNHAAYSFAYAAAAITTGFARAAGFGPGEILTVAALAIAGLGFLTIERGPDTNGFARVARMPAGLGRVPFWGGIIVLISFMAANAAENWSALHIERTLGGSAQEGSFGPAIMALMAGLGQMSGQIAVARLTEARLIRLGTLVAAAGMALVGLAPTPGVAWAGLIITGFGGSVVAPTAFATVGRLSHPDRRALAIARATALGYLGYFFGPPAFGFASELLGLRVAFLATAAIILSVLALFPRLIASAGPTRQDAGRGPETA